MYMSRARSSQGVFASDCFLSSFLESFVFIVYCAHFRDYFGEVGELGTRIARGYIFLFIKISNFSKLKKLRILRPRWGVPYKMWGYGDVSLFRGAFFLKRAEYWYHFFEYVQSYGYLLKKHAELLVIFWGKCGKMPRKTKDMQKLFGDFVAFEEVYLHCRNMDIFH